MCAIMCVCVAFVCPCVRCRPGGVLPSHRAPPLPAACSVGTGPAVPGRRPWCPRVPFQHGQQQPHPCLPPSLGARPSPVSLGGTWPHQRPGGMPLHLCEGVVGIPFGHGAVVEAPTPREQLPWLGDTKRLLTSVCLWLEFPWKPPLQETQAHESFQLSSF